MTAMPIKAPLNGQTLTRIVTVTLLLALEFGSPQIASGAQAREGLQRSVGDPISVTFHEVPLSEVLLAFARFSGHSIVAGVGVSGVVTAEILDQPWRVALQTLVEAQGFVVDPSTPGILRVERSEDVRARQEQRPLGTRSHRVDHQSALELVPALTPLLSGRGRISVAEGVNTLIVTDSQEALDAVFHLLRVLDAPPRGVLISAKIVLVHRTELEAAGVNLAYAFGEGLGVSEGDRSAIGTFGGPPLRPGAATARLLQQVGAGALTLSALVEALVSDQLAQVEAHPQLTVLENQTARLLVGERIPLPTISYGGGLPSGDPSTAWGAGVPLSVRFEEVGIRLVVTPRVVDGDRVLLDLEAERSGVQWVEGAPGFLVNTQEATTRLIVANGGTAVIGGLTVTETVQSQSGVPGLRRIPWLGRLFRSNRVERLERDLLILVTPEIQPETRAEASSQGAAAPTPPVEVAQRVTGQATGATSPYGFPPRSVSIPTRTELSGNVIVLRSLTFHTAGESHGRGLLTLMEGVPAGLELIAERDLDPDLWRRQQGHGRGRRMQIESDRVEFISGVRLGETLGSPLSMVIWNRDWENWTTAMSHLPPNPDENPGALRGLYLPRPGHADLSGVLKYDRRDTRDILERASARETAARVAAGAVARRLLGEFGIQVGSHVRSIGGIEALTPYDVSGDWPDNLNALSDPSSVRVLDPVAEVAMVEAIDAAKEAGDTLGGVFEVVVTGLPVGLGSHVSWDRRLDARLGAAILSIQAVKGVEVGLGFEAARRSGSRVHDAIHRSDAQTDSRTGGFDRSTNGAGGLEGGITTGAPLVVRGAMKPISTLMKNRLPSVDLRSGETAAAATERSDVCAVPAAGVVGEAMVALVLADAFLEKFGGDSMSEVRRNFDGYLAYLSDRGWGGRPLP